MDPIEKEYIVSGIKEFIASQFKDWAILTIFILWICLAAYDLPEKLTTFINGTVFLFIVVYLSYAAFLRSQKSPIHFYPNYLDDEAES